MKTLIAILLSVLVAHSALSQDTVIRAAVSPEDNGLQMDVTAHVERLRDVDRRTKQVVEKSILVIRSSVTNIAKKPLIVPTNTYDGTPSCWQTGGGSYGICFNIGYRWDENRRLIPSPLRFFPVTLQPGDVTELPRYEIEIHISDSIKEVSVEFVVDDGYAKLQEWWSGALRKKVAVSPK